MGALLLLVPGIDSAEEPAAARQAITVAVFDHGDFAGRLKRLGVTVSLYESPDELTAERLAGIDVLFIGTGRAPALAAKREVITGFVTRGGGLIIEQPNETGPIQLLPDELPVKVTNWDYLGSHSQHDPIRDMTLTDFGKTHRITTGLLPTEPGGVFDQVSRETFSPAWTVLAVQCEKPDNVGIAIAEYGSGRVVFEAGNLSPGSMAPGSDRYVCRLLAWAANAEQPIE